ncbi:PIN domain-containing protein [Nonomuraea fuscirosea]|uniref:PIN domain-containing protein n=1 Tax=Nonomuraea fuscirosea TaxID=1291556 RepID=A0A2T0MXK0_9ACTN|nr:PIN domain-containing protein [Nonomuraea fuscirosea]
MRQALGYVLEKTTNLRHFSEEPDDLCVSYLHWSAEMAAHLRGHITARDIDRLILTRRHWALQQIIGSTTFGMPGSAKIAGVAHVVRTELAERVDDLKKAIEAFEDQVQNWSSLGLFVVADSSFYIQHTDRFDKTDFGTLVGAREYETVNLLFPMVVVDELDGLKQHGKNHTRWRAGHTLAVLDRVLVSPTHGIFSSRGAVGLNGEVAKIDVTVEVVLDPPGHTRLPINDDEIIDRAKAIEPLAARAITLLTYDTSQATRGRQAGLRVIKLKTELAAEEPPRA